MLSVTNPFNRGTVWGSYNRFTVARTIGGSKDENLKLKKRRKERRKQVDGWSFIACTGHVTDLTVRGLVYLTCTVCAGRFGSGL